MTTEIWVTGYKKLTVQVIFERQSLNSIQKSRLIKDLYRYSPPNGYCNTTALSVDQIGRIYDLGNTTSISTTRMVVISSQETPNIKLRTSVSSWRNPIVISNQIKEIAGIILPGYGQNAPLSVQNVRSESQNLPSSH
jgi:hypothetical protein